VNLYLYQTLTGITVEASQQAIVIAQINRTQRILETMLGFTLDPELVSTNLYNEQGKTAIECACPNVESDLLPPDPVVFAYRLYDYNHKDKYFHVDPFTDVYSVKLVRDGVTVKTFDEKDYRLSMKQGFGKFIENCQKKICFCDCRCVQLAVDAHWLFNCDPSIGDSSIGCIQDDLLYVWADMITYYVDCKKDIKQESVGSHSYTKFDRDEKPEYLKHNLAVLNKYAGPLGSLTKVLTV
jgi:hypothetical protein